MKRDWVGSKTGKIVVVVLKEQDDMFREGDRILGRGCFNTSNRPLSRNIESKTDNPCENGHSLNKCDIKLRFLKGEKRRTVERMRRNVERMRKNIERMRRNVSRADGMLGEGTEF